MICTLFGARERGAEGGEDHDVLGVFLEDVFKAAVEVAGHGLGQLEVNVE